jgi:YfiH family protein
VLPLIRFDLLGDTTHAISTRLGGVSRPPYDTLNLGYANQDDEVNVAANRATFLQALGVDTALVVSGWLSHGTEIAVFPAGEADRWPLSWETMRPGGRRRERLFRADAAVTDARGVYFMLTFGDCVPLLFADRRHGVVAAAHAGWRGTAGSIGPAVVRAMRKQFGCDPADIVVGIGPSIGPCCYAVGAQVVETFRNRGAIHQLECRDGLAYLDLWASNERQLTDAGIMPGSIENARLCTSCRTDLFFSHRAENGSTGRFGLCIGNAPDDDG